MFEIHVGELRATFLRNHNMRRHKGATSAPSRRRPKPRRPPQPRQPPQARGTTPDKGHYTRSGALHPLRGAAPVTWRCTRYVALHPLRGGAPEQKRCIAYGSGRPNAQEQTRNWHTESLTASPLHAQLGPTGGRMGTPPTPPTPPTSPTPAPARRPRRPRRHLHSGPLRHLHSGPLRHLPHLPHPYMRRASKRPGSRQRPRPLRL